MVDNVENIGPHYARTLREWRNRFLVAWDKLAKVHSGRPWNDINV
jgi:cyclopropane-fatty-acyl-phospholipid synthase